MRLVWLLPKGENNVTVVTTPGSFGMRLLMPGMMSPLVIEALVSVLQRSILELEANLRYDLDRAVVGT